MIRAIKSSWRTLTDTLGLVVRAGMPSLYDLIACAVVLLATFGWIIPSFELALSADQTWTARAAFLVVVWSSYALLYFAVSMSHVALLIDLSALLDGHAVDAFNGMAMAFKRVRAVGGYSFISATLGAMPFTMRSAIGPFLGLVVTPFVAKQAWLRWRHLAYAQALIMALPVIALDPATQKGAYWRAEELIETTWGDEVAPVHRINVLAFIVLPVIAFLAAPALASGMAGHNADLIRTGLGIMLVAIGGYLQLNALVNAVVALAAYRYATAAKSDVFPGDPSYAEHAFVRSGKEPKPARPQARPAVK